MAGQHAFHLGRVDILASRDDHVLDPVANEKITAEIDIARIARTQPAIRVYRVAGSLRQVPVADHVALGADRDLSDLSAREFTPLGVADADRSEEHTSELQSLMRSSYDVFCLK